MRIPYESATRVDRPSNLEAMLEGARLAFACPYSSSDEYEAATIEDRRAAGAYRSPLSMRGIVWVGGVAAIAVAIVVAL